MKNIFTLSLLLICTGCSHFIERTEKYNQFKLEGGYTREDIIEKLGPPEKSVTYKREDDENYILPPNLNSETKEYINNFEQITDTYLVEGRVFDCGDYWASAAGWGMTLGLHEIIFFPMSLWEVAIEGISPSKKYLDIMYINGSYQCQTEREIKKP